MSAHRYGPHRSEDAPTHCRTQNGDGAPLHPDLIAQRARLNAIATGKASTLAAVNAAAPEDVKARIDAAILRVAGRGGEFSANDFRDMFPDSGPIVGARVNTLAKQHGWKSPRMVASTKASTNGHKIHVWRAA